MKNVFIKYNPYKLETTLTVNNRPLKQNSRIAEQIDKGSRLQEWIEDLPRFLVDEFNDNNFDIKFHGTAADYDDLMDVFSQACHEKENLSARIDRIPAKETTDKLALIEDVFKEIQKGPFEELKSQDIVNAFQNAKSSDFEVCVVATMSAGKSTLINAMLGDKLMPSKQEACTAIITRIKDNEKASRWKAEVYDKENHHLATYNNVSYDLMGKLNNDENVSEIHMTGNIPFVSAEDTSLVLIDTPGPNNARNPDHRRVQNEFLSKSSKSLVLYIMEGTFGNDDDNRLLDQVASSMQVGGKQSKDRFLFVINKMDDRRKEDGEITDTLGRIRAYLKEHGIENPNLFPAAALPALNIRMMQRSADLDDDTLDETEMKVRKLNRSLHFDDYATLPASVKKEIRNDLEEAEKENDKNNTALIHTGIVSVEAAIRQYVEKYAKTAKIKNVVDTFTHKLEEIECFEKTKKELAANVKDGERIAAQIASIRKKIDDGNEAQKFQDTVNATLDKTNTEIDAAIKKVVKYYQDQINARSKTLDGAKLSPENAELEAVQLQKYAARLEPNFKDDLNEVVTETLITTGNQLLDDYKNKLASLLEDIDTSMFKGIAIEPIKLIGGDIATINVSELTREERVEAGQEWVKNTDKKWYKPWTWFQESGYYRTLYKNEKYVLGNDLAQRFFSPIEENLRENGHNAQVHAKQEAIQVAQTFNQKFAVLDGILKSKLLELESYASDQKEAEARIAQSKRKLEWLSNIQNRVESILEI